MIVLIGFALAASVTVAICWHCWTPDTSALWKRLVRQVSGEWILDRRANGGDVVLARAAWTTMWFFSSSVLCVEMLSLETEWSWIPPCDWFDMGAGWGCVITALGVAAKRVHWFGAIFAGVYVTLHTRYASQWLYLANVYNQIKTAECRIEVAGDATGANGGTSSLPSVLHDGPRSVTCLAQWKAGFVADAIELHLDKKELFASAICVWAQERAVRDSYDKVNGEGALSTVVKELEDALRGS